MSFQARVSQSERSMVALGRWVGSHASRVPRPLFTFWAWACLSRAWKEARVVASLTVELFVSHSGFMNIRGCLRHLFSRPFLLTAQ